MEGPRSKDYDPELDKVPHYMREKVAYLIDSIVEKRVRAYMDDFRNECFQEIADQRQVNQEHIQYYTSK